MKRTLPLKQKPMGFISATIIVTIMVTLYDIIYSLLSILYY